MLSKWFKSNFCKMNHYDSNHCVKCCFQELKIRLIPVLLWQTSVNKIIRFSLSLIDNMIVIELDFASTVSGRQVLYSWLVWLLIYMKAFQWHGPANWPWGLCFRYQFNYHNSVSCQISLIFLPVGIILLHTTQIFCLLWPNRLLVLYS